MNREDAGRIEQIRKLESAARRLDLTQDQRREWNRTTLSFADDFLEHLNELPAYQSENYDLNSFSVETYLENGTALPELLEYLDNHLHQPGINAASGGHLGYVPGGGLYGSSLGDYLAAVFNRYAGVYFAAPGAVKMENSLIRWTGNLIGYEGDFAGNITSGGSIANMIAIATARTANKIRARDYHNHVIYFSAQVHHCVTKDLRIMGMDECILRQIPVDDEFRMNTHHLEMQIRDDKKSGLKPFLLIGTAGTTDSGVIDPLHTLADICEQEGIWFHVDAAYGGYFILTSHGRQRLSGIERSDSFVVDPHKSLFLPFGTGIVVVRNSVHLKKAHNATASYMQDTYAFDQELSPADASPELTKHFRGLRMWLPLRLHGIAPFRACLEEKLALAAYFYQKVQELDYSVGPNPELSIVLFRKGMEASTNDLNQRIAERVIRDGSIFMSTTSINGIYWLRVAILSFRTHLEHIDGLLKKLAEINKDL